MVANAAPPSDTTPVQFRNVENPPIMGMNFSSVSERRGWERIRKENQKEEDARTAAKRRELAGKIVMVVVDRIVHDIVRPGPKPEERECYVMAAELRAITSDLEELVKKIIDVNEGVE